ncbi:hypothetical protein IWW47_001715, partial [Coemansia sp. RSA 2052]
MDAEMTDIKNHHHIDHQEVEEDVAVGEEGLHDAQKHHHHHHHHHQHHEHDEHMVDAEAEADAAAAIAAAGGDPHYEQHYDESYAQQYEEGGEEHVEGGGEALYEGQEAEYEQGADGVSFDVAVDAAAAVASAAAAHVGQEGEYVEDGQQPQEYAEQQEYAGHDGYMDDSTQQYAEQAEDDQTLAAHPATTRDLESMVVDGEGGAISSEVNQAMTRYDYAPDGLQTLAATSSAVTPHDTPSRYSMHGKPMMPKFNRARNWSTEETKILLIELERIASGHPDDRRETVLRSHSTFEEIAEILREKGYSNRDGQGCMIRWRNLLRVYKQLRAQSNDGNPPSGHPNMQYASAIENIYRFPPDSMHYLHSEGSPGLEGSPAAAGMARTWTAANGAYETPARKRTREITMVTEHIDNVDQKLEQTM